MDSNLNISRYMWYIYNIYPQFNPKAQVNEPQSIAVLLISITPNPTSLFT